MRICFVTVIALVTSIASAKMCNDMTVQLNLTARTGVFDIPNLISNSDATTFVQNLTQLGQNFTEVALTGYETTAGLYSISTQFCTPTGNLPQNPTIQILTHGVGFDKRQVERTDCVDGDAEDCDSYWDLPYNNFNYSYVDVAVGQYQYFTLSYDRLGLGASSHGDPVNEVQASLEVALLAELTTMVRKGKYPGAMQPFKKVTHVG